MNRLIIAIFCLFLLAQVAHSWQCRSVTWLYDNCGTGYPTCFESANGDYWGCQTYAPGADYYYLQTTQAVDHCWYSGYYADPGDCTGRWWWGTQLSVNVYRYCPYACSTCVGPQIWNQCYSCRNGYWKWKY